MINKILEIIYAKIFVNIIVNRSTTSVYVEVTNKNGIVDSKESEFETITIDENMFNFIKSYIDNTPFFYISILDTSIDQGAVPTCTKIDMPKFYIPETSKHICVEDKWAYYSSKYDLNKTESTYKDIGIDFIFSPFSVLSIFFADKINSNLSIFVLVQESYLSLAIFDNSALLFAKHLDMEHEDDDAEELLMGSNLDEDEEEEDFDLDDNVNLDDLDVDDDISSLDDFGDIEDLGDMDDIDEFSEDQEMDELVEVEEKIISTDTSTEGFNEDYQRYSLIQGAINSFYKDSKYESKFVETIYIADSVGVTSDLKRYLEEEMFLSVYVRRIDLGAEICEMAKAEI